MVNIGLVAFLLLSPQAAPQEEPQELKELLWPRQLEQGGDKVVVYDPQIDSWEKHELVQARAAVVVTPSGSKDDLFGVIEYTVETEVEAETRQVLLKNRKFTAIRFTGIDKDKAEKSEAIVRRVLGTQPGFKLSLDFALAYESEHAARTPSVTVNLAPPPVYVSLEPAILVIFLGDPDFKPIQGTSLKFATNTNWDVIQDPAASKFYLLHGEGWLATPDLRKGPWEMVKTVPAEFSKLPADANWAEARKAIPGKLVPVPKVVFSAEPAELIILDGRPVLAPIPGTGLAAISNTESDLFRDEKGGMYYFLTSGRWFKSATLDGPWFAATADLPGDFSKIPADNDSADVRASVPGTPEAGDAVLLASVPRKATVNRKELTLAVTYDGEPKFEAIEKTGVWYALNTPYSVFRVRERYYCCYEAVWFESAAPTGPWAVCDKVPAEIYTIPPNHPKYNVTYVTVYSSTPETVVVGYTSGYTGMYVYSGVVMFGFGYPMYYGPYWYYHYPCHWYAYGCGARYGWYGGAYYRSGYGYGPYGGVGFATAYNPSTGTYARGVAAYGPYGGTRYAAQSYNPYTGTYKARSGGSTPYSSWERGVAVQGNDWVKGGYYSNSRGTVAGGSSSEGGKVIGVGNGEGDRGYVGRDKNGDIYAGRDGNVYKKTDGGWQKYGDGGWTPVNPRDNPSAGTRDIPKVSETPRDLPKPSTTPRDLPQVRDTPRPSTTDTMNRLQNESQYRSRGTTQATRQYTPRAGGGARGGRGGRR